MGKREDETGVPYALTHAAFRDRLWAIKELYGWNEHQFAEVCGAGFYAPKRWLDPKKGNFAPPLRMLALQAHTGISLDWIYQGKTVDMPSEDVAELEQIILEGTFRNKA